MTDYQVRLAQGGDIAQLVKLWAACLTDQLDYEDKIRPIDTNLVYYRSMLTKLISAGEVIVADSGNELCGMVVIFEEALPLETTIRTAIVADMFVADHFRRRGVGRALIQFAKQIAIQRRFDKVRLHVYRSNIGAEALYALEGFRPTLKIMDWVPND